VLAPFVAIERPNTFDVNVNVSGGGTKGNLSFILFIPLCPKHSAHTSSHSRPSRGHPAGHCQGSAELQPRLPPRFEERCQPKLAPQ
jgi:hypothetical protein